MNSERQLIKVDRNAPSIGEGSRNLDKEKRGREVRRGMDRRRRPTGEQANTCTTNWSRVEEPGRGEMRKIGEVEHKPGEATNTRADKNTPPIGAGLRSLGEEKRARGVRWGTDRVR